MWGPVDLESSFISTSTKESASFEPFEQGATAKAFIPIDQRYVMLVRWKQLLSYITSDMGHIHEFYMAEYEARARMTMVLGAEKLPVLQRMIPGKNSNLAS